MFTRSITVDITNVKLMSEKILNHYLLYDLLPDLLILTAIQTER